MKYNLNTANALTNNKNASMDFKIGDAAVIIDILRNRLYSDKIRVVAQEYLSNARDAMREAGNTTDCIEVTLPTVKKPVLTIRDFGPGLSVERVGEIFVQFGKSTKRDSETQTGGFGLGGKSAFAYTDSFTVISIHDGVETHYVAHIGKNSVGSLDQVYQVKTKSKSGVEIQIGVNKTRDNDESSDIERFNSMVYRAIAFWSKEEMPVVTNEYDASQCQWYLLHSAVQSGQGFQTDKAILIPPKKNHSYSKNLYLVIDGIVYDDLDGDDRESKQRDTIKSIVADGSDTYLILDAGMLEISASREAIAVNQKNEVVLNGAMTGAFKALEKKTKKMIADVETIDDAKKCLKLISLIDGSPRNVVKDVQGIYINFDDGKIAKDQGIYGLYAHGYRRKSFSPSQADMDAFFILNDDDLAESTLQTKVRELHKNRGLEKFGILPKGFDKQAEILGAIPVSTLKAVRAYTEKEKLPEGKVNLRVFRGTRDVTEYDHVDTSDTDMLYVLVENVETRDDLMQYRALQTLLDEYCSKPVKIAFPSRAAMKALSGKECFVKKDDFFADLKKHLGDKELNTFVGWLKQLHGLRVQREFETLFEVASEKNVQDQKFVKHAKVLTSIKPIKAKDEKMDEHNEMSRLIRDTLVKTVFDKLLGEVSEMDEFMEYVKKTYPLVEDLSSYSETDRAEIVHYLNGKYASMKAKVA